MLTISFILAVVLAAVDQIIKIVVVDKISIGEVIKVIRFGSHDIFSLTHVTNDGAAWSIMSGKSWFLIGMPIALCLFIFGYMIFRRKDSKFQLISLALVASGGIGNLIDRIRVGEVVDYIRFEPINFPIFNFADVCIVVGVIMFSIHFIFIEELQKKKALKATTEKIEDKDD